MQKENFKFEKSGIIKGFILAVAISISVCAVPVAGFDSLPETQSLAADDKTNLTEIETSSEADEVGAADIINRSKKHVTRTGEVYIIIALDAEDAFGSLGTRSIHAVSNINQAWETLRREKIDFALLDFNLGAETSEQIAERLLEEKIPFVFASGYGELAINMKELANIHVIQKPYGKDDILNALKQFG